MPRRNKIAVEAVEEVVKPDGSVEKEVVATNKPKTLAELKAERLQAEVERYREACKTKQLFADLAGRNK